MTRHNMGFLVVQALAYLCRLSFKEEKRFLAKVARGKIHNVDMHLVLPSTYMNESGQAVRSYLDYFKLTAQDVVVVSDDVDLPFGEMRLRTQGSAGGHNGLKSVERHLGTMQYARLRLGIGRGRSVGEGIVGHVLDRFTASELEQLPPILEEGARVLARLLNETVETVMNEVNVRPKKGT